MKKAITALLCIVLCLGLMVPAMGTNSEGVTFTAVLNTDTLNVSESEQTVTLKISGTPAFDADSFEYEVDYPAGWTAVSVASEDVTISAGDYNLTYSDHVLKLLWNSSDSENVTGISDLGTITFTVPANAAAGSYDFKISSFNVMKDYGTTWETGSTLTATLTIKDSSVVASTGATLDKTAASVTVGGSITLIPSLLPTETAATVSSVTWDSSAPAVATVDGGVVTGVAEGTATITAHVTPSDSTTVYDATCTVTVTASPYTVSVKRDGTGVVHAGDSVTMNVSVTGDAYAGLQATVTYDSTLFDYVSASGDATATAATGSIELYYNDNEKADGATVAVLTFTAKEPSGDSADGVFDFSYAKACSSVSALNGTGPSAKEGDTVTVVKQYTVKFMNKDGAQIGSDIKVDAGSKLTDVPEAPAVDYYDFAGWSDGTTTYATADAVKALVISKDTTFTATYEAKTYGVTLQSGLTGADEATYGTDYTVTVTGYDSDYAYVVSYTVAGGEEQTATDNGNGTFTIPGENITGNLNVTFTKKVNATVEVHADYVNGYTLVTVASTGNAYSYDGNAMFYLSSKGECAWLVEGSVTKEAATALVDAASAHAGTITFSNDINGDGKIDIDDAVVVNSVLNKRYTVSSNMAVYLRANVNAYDSYKIDAADINAIITDAAYEK